MYTYAEFAAIVKNARELESEYKDRYDSFLTGPGIAKQIKYSSRRTVHDLKECPRPDLMSLDRDMCFFDNSISWRTKKQHPYTINMSSEGLPV